MSDLIAGSTGSIMAISSGTIKMPTNESLDRCGEPCINDRASFMERRKFTLHSNGMIAGGYEEKVCNSMLEGIFGQDKREALE